MNSSGTVNLALNARPFVRHRNDTGRLHTRLEVRCGERPRSAGHPTVSVVIPSRDGFRDGCLPRLLDQLFVQSFRDFEVIVVVGDERQGRAINTGADVAGGRYILTLDDDSILSSSDAIARLINAMESDPGIGMAGGRNAIPEDASAFVKKTMRQIPRRSTPPVERVTDSDFAEHALLAMRLDAFKSVGGENEFLTRGLDPYLRDQFRRAGYRVVVVPGATYSHLPPSNAGVLVREFYRNGKAAGVCNRLYPQWVFEAPAVHSSHFPAQRPVPYRIVRYAANLVLNCLRGRWIYVIAYTAYAAGFVAGYLGEMRRRRGPCASA